MSKDLGDSTTSSHSPSYELLPQSEPSPYDAAPQTNMQEYQPATGGHSGGLNVTAVTVQACSLEVQKEPKPKNYICLSVLNTFCCCPILGFIGLYKGYQVNKLYKNGRYSEAKRASKQARALNATGFVAGIMLGILIVVIKVLLYFYTNIDGE